MSALSPAAIMKTRVIHLGVTASSMDAAWSDAATVAEVHLYRFKAERVSVMMLGQPVMVVTPFERTFRVQFQLTVEIP